MSIKLLRYNPEQVSGIFLFNNVNLSIINSFRRIMLCDIKTSGFLKDNITIIKNTSVFSDEYIMHRLTLIPINTAKFCTLELNVINIGNTSINVCASSFKFLKGDGDLCENIIICQLKKGEEIQIVMKNTFSTCKESGIPFRPIAMCYFKPAQFLMNKDRIVPKNINIIKTETNDCIGICENLMHMNDDELNMFIDGPKNSLYTLKKKNTIYLFYIEAFLGSNNPINILQTTIKLFKGQVEYLLFDKIIKQSPLSYKVIFDKKYFTILLPFVDYMKKCDNVKFCHYNQTHPYAKEIEYYIVFINEITTQNNTAIESLFESVKKKILNVIDKINFLVVSD